MIKIEMKVGSKGQVVIPAVFRKNLHINPGDKVIFESEGDSLLVKSVSENIVDKLEKIAKEGGSVTIDSDKDYDEMMKERLE